MNTTTRILVTLLSTAMFATAAEPLIVGIDGSIQSSTTQKPKKKRTVLKAGQPFSTKSVIARAETPAPATPPVAKATPAPPKKNHVETTMAKAEKSSHAGASPTIAALSAGLRTGDDVDEYFGDLLIPVLHDEGKTLSLNVRASALEDKEDEWNAGLVYRRIADCGKAILGANVFYDQRSTEAENDFGQIGVGIEMLSTRLDVRANYYSPTDDPKVMGTSSSTAGGITSTTTRYEEALEGFDAEIGTWLPLQVSGHKIPTGVFAGYYAFNSDHGEDLDGLRLRLESRVCANFTLDAEWFDNEDLNRTEYFAGFRLHYRFGEQANADHIGSRLHEMVNRDFRVRTQMTETTVETAVQVEVRRSSSTPVAEEGVNCRLDSEGNVVCD